MSDPDGFDGGRWYANKVIPEKLGVDQNKMGRWHLRFASEEMEGISKGIHTKK